MKALGNAGVRCKEYRGVLRVRCAILARPNDQGMVGRMSSAGFACWSCVLRSIEAATHKEKWYSVSLAVDHGNGLDAYHGGAGEAFASSSK